MFPFGCVQNSTVTIEEFHSRLQEATNFPLRPFVIPFLKVNLQCPFPGDQVGVPVKLGLKWTSNEAHAVICVSLWPVRMLYRCDDRQPLLLLHMMEHRIMTACCQRSCHSIQSGFKYSSSGRFHYGS